MKSTVQFFVVGLLSVLAGACSEYEVPTPPRVGHINVINAVLDVPNVKARSNTATASWGATSTQTAFATGRVYRVFEGQRQFDVVASLDTARALFTRQLQLSGSDYYSLLLSGNAAQVDTLLLKEVALPFIRTDVAIPASADSVVHVRFINLSPDAPALAIGIRGTGQDGVNALGYQQVSAWVRYPSRMATTSYVFEVKSTVDDSVLATYTFVANAANRFKNVSLVVKGSMAVPSGTNAIGVFPVNYY